MTVSIQRPAHRRRRPNRARVDHDERGTHGPLSSVLSLSIGTRPRKAAPTAPIYFAGDGARVRVEQELGRIAAMAVRRSHDRAPEPVALPGSAGREVAVPAKSRLRRQVTLRFRPVSANRQSWIRVATSENTGEVGAAAIPTGASGKGSPARFRAIEFEPDWRQADDPGRREA